MFAVRRLEKWAPLGRQARLLLMFNVDSAPSRRRWVSSGPRHFFQRLNEKHLAHELKHIGEIARQGAEGLKPQPFDATIKTRPVMRRKQEPFMVVARRSQAMEELPDWDADGSKFPSYAENASSVDFESATRQKPWLAYERLRGDTYPGGPLGVRHKDGSVGPRWQDLTHSEAQRLQEMQMRKRMLQRKLLWLKQQDLPNPQKEAKMAVRRKEEEQKMLQADNDVKLYPPPFLDEHPGSRKLSKMLVDAQRDELESRFRNRIRLEKQENARIAKASVPEVGGITIDPIRRHVQRRLLRQRPKIHYGLENFLTHNSAQVLYEFLQGASISIVRVGAKRPRQTQNIFYNVSSDHDPAWVQSQLDILAPKLRSQLAVSVNMGQTPNIRFVPHRRHPEMRRSHLWRFARAIKSQVPTGGVGVRPTTSESTT